MCGSFFFVNGTCLRNWKRAYYRMLKFRASSYRICEYGGPLEVEGFSQSRRCTVVRAAVRRFHCCCPREAGKFAVPNVKLHVGKFDEDVVLRTYYAVLALRMILKGLKMKCDCAGKVGFGMCPLFFSIIILNTQVCMNCYYMVKNLSLTRMTGNGY